MNRPYDNRCCGLLCTVPISVITTVFLLLIVTHSAMSQTDTNTDRIRTPAPSTWIVRRHLMAVINAKKRAEANMLRRAYDAATGGSPNVRDTINDARSVARAKQSVKTLIDTHGLQLTHSLAELCFDRNNDVASLAADLLTGLGKEAKEILGRKNNSSDRSTLYLFAYVKVFGELPRPIPSSLLWKEAISQSRYSKLALDQLSQLPEGMLLNPDQVRFLAKGLGSSDELLVQSCLSIARRAKSLDDDVLEAVCRVANSPSYLAEQANIILAKYPGRRKKQCARLIRELADYPANLLYGHDPTAHYRITLAERIRIFKPEANMLAPLVSKLSDPRESHRVRLAIVHLFRDAGESSVVHLISKLQDNHTPSAVRRKLLKAIGMIGIASDPVLHELIRWVRNGDARERELALASLGNMGPEASSTIDVLFEVTQDYQTGADAMRAIKQIVKDPDEQLLRRLLPALESPMPYVQMYATDIFLEAGPKAKCVLPDILRLSYSTKAPRGNIASILGAIGIPDQQVVRRLAQMATERGGVDNRRRAIESLGRLGPGAKAASPTLARIVAHGHNNRERYEAIWTLIQIGDGSPIVIDALKALLQKVGPSEYEWFSAVALISLGEPAAEYRKTLEYLINNAREEFELRFADIAAQQLLAIDEGNQLAKKFIEHRSRSKELSRALESSRP